MDLKNLIKPMALSCLLPLVLAANAANAENNIFNNPADFNFVTIKAGVNQPTNVGGNAEMDSVDTTYAAGLEVGRKMMDIFAVSLEYNHRGNSDFNGGSAGGSTSTSWSAKSDTFLFNLSADLIKDSKITPFFKAGLGVSRNKSGDYVMADKQGNVQNTYEGKTVSKFAWQAGVGLNIATNDMLDTEISYMFMDRGKIESSATYSNVKGRSITSASGPATGRLKDHVISIGLRIKF
jgi:opacity protein-like surface antigen